MTKIKLGSLFDGSGGFPLGGLLAGIEPVWASEIEPFPMGICQKKQWSSIRKMMQSVIEPQTLTKLSLVPSRSGPHKEALTEAS